MSTQKPTVEEITAKVAKMKRGHLILAVVVSLVAMILLITFPSTVIVILPALIYGYIWSLYDISNLMEVSVHLIDNMPLHNNLHKTIETRLTGTFGLEELNHKDIEIIKQRLEVLENYKPELDPKY